MPRAFLSPQPHYPLQEQKRKTCLPVIEMAACFERQHPCPSDISATPPHIQTDVRGPPDRHQVGLNEEYGPTNRFIRKAALKWLQSLCPSAGGQRRETSITLPLFIIGVEELQLMVNNSYDQPVIWKTSVQGRSLKRLYCYTIKVIPLN